MNTERRIQAKKKKKKEKNLQDQFWLLKFDQDNDENNSTHNETAYTWKYKGVVSKETLGMKYAGVLGGRKC